MSYSPVVMFVYNRADHFSETFAALSECPEAKDTELFIFSDGPKSEEGRPKVEACREAVRVAVKKGGFKNITVTESPVNKGLAASVISGVTDIVGRYGSVIVIEDDSVASPYLLTFMNRVLDNLRDDRRAGAVAGYTPSIEFPADYGKDVFTSFRSCSCAWATWVDRWENIDWELKDFGAFCRDVSLVKKLNSCGSDRFIRLYRQTKGNGSSWSVRFGAHLVKNDMLTVYPRYSYIRNIGCDESGVHSTSEDAETMNVDLSKAIPSPAVEFAEPDKRIIAAMKKHYSGGTVSDIKRAAATAAIIIKGKLK